MQNNIGQNHQSNQLQTVNGSLSLDSRKPLASNPESYVKLSEYFQGKKMTAFHNVINSIDKKELVIHPDTATNIQTDQSLVIQRNNVFD